jgi:hypothetical protein
MPEVETYIKILNDVIIEMQLNWNLVVVTTILEFVVFCVLHYTIQSVKWTKTDAEPGCA